MRYTTRYIVFIVALCAAVVATAQPRLAVNIVVSGMSQGDIARYEKNFGKDGFLRLRSEGVEFTECYADYAPTTPEAGLATLATGTSPATHGIFSSVLFDRTSNREIKLCEKANLQPSIAQHRGAASQYTTQQFTVQTLSEAVIASHNSNRAITIAHTPISAMILAGRKGECYWIDNNGKWSTAECYTKELPLWVEAYNRDELNRVFATDSWYGRYTRDYYRNSHSTDIALYEKSGNKRPRSQRKESDKWIENLMRMPSGNIAIFEFAKRAINSLLPLRVGEECKVLNICLDIPRIIAEKYGADSIEYEDMLYSLDISLAEFLTYLYAQTSSRQDIVVTLTSDGGVSPTIRDNNDSSRFNTRQFEVIMNAFLSARYGQDSWILGYSNGSLYLNHDVVYKHKKSLVEIQNEVAAFALQYRGITNAITATALRSTQFSRGAVALVQNGYNPRRSGDVLITLEAERIELDSERVAMSGSIYSYDRHIPLIISGAGIVPRQEIQRISNEQIAPSLATLIGVSRPQYSEAAILHIK